MRERFHLGPFVDVRTVSLRQPRIMPRRFAHMVPAKAESTAIRNHLTDLFGLENTLLMAENGSSHHFDDQ